MRIILNYKQDFRGRTDEKDLGSLVSNADARSAAMSGATAVGKTR
ncbi:hypothetical protein PAMC26577_18330 [Caballeronia sordidicola]|uniref:Uncharacterized protein n=1 Tax=Caballeronia sordidicola TaxID=196367 RepID=A0A242MQW2_CABSO|nr:hypothetical protein PAMC26577_18330 [Caballeronia sordidicola]